MKRLNKYIVLKISDVDDCLDGFEREKLQELQLKIANHREAMSKSPLKCAVVEHDWPMYELVWREVEKWVDNDGQ